MKKSTGEFIRSIRRVKRVSEMTGAKCTRYNYKERLFCTFKSLFNYLYQSEVVK